MKKFLVISVCCLILYGCGNKEKASAVSNSNEFVCYDIKYDGVYTVYEKSILSIEHDNGTVVNVISKMIKKCNDIDDLHSSKQIYDYNICDIGDSLFCNSYVDEENLLLIEEDTFLPDVTTDLNEYIKFLEKNGYKCTQY